MGTTFCFVQYKKMSLRFDGRKVYDAERGRYVKWKETESTDDEFMKKFLLSIAKLSKHMHL
jgi:predicted NAD-dependent protein-ADP-ribosyltransferase YbiA (DUF1768 family)